MKMKPRIDTNEHRIVYKELSYEIMNVALAEQQVPIKVNYKDEIVGDHIADIVVEEITKIHEAQMINYLKATGIKLGIILNFSKPELDYKRIVL
jgi:GxxExxY protein